MTKEDLGPILDTLREVNESLDRRAARAAAATGVTWGLVASSIFAFYAWAYAAPHAPLVQALRGSGAMPWMWVPPLLVGYAVNLSTGVRLGRMAPRSEEARRVRWLLLALLVPVSAVVAVSLAGSGERLVPAMWIAFLGLAHLQWGPAPRDAPQRVAIAASFALAPAILLMPLGWAYAAAALWYLAALAGLCAWRYHAA